MLFYTVKVSYSQLPCEGKDNDTMTTPFTAEQSKQWKKEVASINETINDVLPNKQAYVLYIHKGDDCSYEFLMAFDVKEANVECAKEMIIHVMKLNYKYANAKISGIEETTLEQWMRFLNQAESAELIGRGVARDVERTYDIDYQENYAFHIKETVINTGATSLKELLDKAKVYMPDQSLVEEIHRIYSRKNKKEFFGHPVHYKITSGSKDSAECICKLLVEALYSNHRVLGTRINLIDEIEEGCYRESDLENLFKASAGSTIVIDLKGSSEEHSNYASCFEEVVNEFSELISKYIDNTLFIFLEDIRYPGFSSYLLSKVTDKLDIIEIQEGCGDKQKAAEYLAIMMENSKFARFKEPDVTPLLPDMKSYKASDVFAAYQKWYREGLRSKVYRAYEKCDKIHVSLEQETCAKEELTEMIGLKDVKTLISQVVSLGKINKIRRTMGLTTQKNFMHMIFTGNPGSAKTSVARLLARILNEEGILERGEYVEVGRADLVGKYVGWTAKTVQEKFRQARGGVLFIDEAYSLVDGSNSFGDEAINTIVQEMENSREKVIVILAGYPKKMEQFLKKNEGLRSRIAYHVSFPDYTAEELIQMIQLMTVKRGYEIDPPGIEKCKSICSMACLNEGYGNGRFARNLLEQAIAKQSNRIYELALAGEVSKKEMCILKEEDFDVNLGEQYAKPKKNIGFLAGSERV